jgi:hypothetical protein
LRGIVVTNDQKRAALASIAAHFGASSAGRGAAGRLTIAGKPVAIEIASIAAPAARRRGAAPPRLRFDRVVLRVIARLRAALDEAVPKGATVVFTLTAPIRVPGRTAAALEEHAGALLKKRSGRKRLAVSVHGNEIEMRIVATDRDTHTSKVVGFVHNPGTDTAILFDLTEGIIESAAVRGRRDQSAPRWLALVIEEEEPRWIDTYRHACEQVFARTCFERILLLSTRGLLTSWRGARDE